MQIGKGDLEAHRGNIAQPQAHMVECDRVVVSWIRDRGHWCRVSQEQGVETLERCDGMTSTVASKLRLT